MRKFILIISFLCIPVIIFFIYQQIRWNSSYREFKYYDRYGNGNLKIEEIRAYKFNDIRTENILTKKYYDDKEILTSTTVKKIVGKMKFRDGWFHTIYRIPKFDSVSHYPNGNKSKEFSYIGLGQSINDNDLNSYALTTANLFYENGNIYKSYEFNNSVTFLPTLLNFSKEKTYHPNGKLWYSKNYITESDKKENWVRHRFKNSRKFEIDKNFMDWSRGDTIINSYKFKSFDEFGQIISIGIYKPLTIEDDSDVFKVDGKLSNLEIFNYKMNIGLRLPNGRMNGSTEIIHPKLNPNLKLDLRTGTKEEKTYWSSPQISLKNSKRSYDDRPDEEYMLFSGVVFTTNHRYMSSLTTDREVLKKLNKNIDNQLASIDVYKDGLKLFELDLRDCSSGVNSEMAKEFFTSKSFETDPNEYLTVKADEYEYSHQYYINNLNLFENKFEFRLGNFTNITSPIVYDFNDVINSPQGKLIKVKK